ncbi:unnamed protein product, partial [Ilex paraguariensis]
MLKGDVYKLGNNKELCQAVGYFLNPQFQYATTSSRETFREIIDGTQKVIQRLEPNIECQIKAINQ